MPITKLVLLLLTLLFLTACLGNHVEESSGYHEPAEIQESLTQNENMPRRVPATTITARQAEEMILQGGVIILDVRTRAEFESGHIENAVLLPYNQITELAAILISDKNQTVLVYCQAGGRSRIAANALSDMGFTSVYDFGGLMHWHGEIIRP